MTDRWQWALEAWERHFAPLREMGLTLERVEQAEYWRVHEAELRQHFPPEAFIDLGGLRSQTEQDGQARVAAARDDHPLRIFCIARAGAQVAATFCSEHKQGGVYRMWHTHVHPDHRRRGIYRAILRGTIAYTAELGFDRIVSEHAPGNNPVIIAKLGAGFRILALEIDPMVGLSVVLCYFHNPDHLAAYEFRCGLATLTPRIIARGGGAMDLLRAQFRAADEAADE